MKKAGQPPKTHPDRRVVWDEDNLDYNEANKTATMKIEEAPTPFIPCTDVQLSDDEHSGADTPNSVNGECQDSINARLEAARQVVKDLASLSAVSGEQGPGEDHGDAHAEGESAGKTLMPTCEERELERQATEERKREFAAKRAKHYNEWHMVKQKMSEPGDEEDEDEEDKQEEEAPESKPQNSSGS